LFLGDVLTGRFVLTRRNLSREFAEVDGSAVLAKILEDKSSSLVLKHLENLSLREVLQAVANVLKRLGLVTHADLTLQRFRSTA
jgi:hypothetical protein